MVLIRGGWQGFYYNTKNTFSVISSVCGSGDGYLWPKLGLPKTTDTSQNTNFKNFSKSEKFVVVIEQ